MESFNTECSAPNDNNDSPITDEWAHGRQLIRRREKELHALDEQMAQLQVTRDSCAASLAELRYTLSPIKRAPVEILGKIFLLTIVDEEIIIDFSSLRRPSYHKKMPWILGYVCSNWRLVLHTEPLLWRYLQFKASVLDIQNGVLQRLDQILPYRLTSLDLVCQPIHTDSLVPFHHPCLSHLRKIRLDIPLVLLINSLAIIPDLFALLDDIDLKAADREVHPTLSNLLGTFKLFRVAQNITRLSLGADHEPVSWQMIRLPDIPREKLIRLDLSTVDLPRELYPDLINIFRQCTNLRDLACMIEEVQGLSLNTGKNFLPSLTALKICGENPDSVAFPWSQLQSLSFQWAEVSSMRSVLQKTPRIESLCLFYPHVPQTEYRDPPLLLSHLHSLTIHHASIYILDHLIAPNLLTLCVPLVPSFLRPFNVPSARILSFIRCSNISLASLHFNLPVMGNNDDHESFLRECLVAIRSVKELHAPHMFFTRNLLNQLKQGHILPNIQSLLIRIASADAFAAVVEHRVAESLVEGFIRLKKAHGYYPESYKSDTLKDVRNVLGRLKALNASHGTDFGLRAVGTKTWGNRTGRLE